MNIKRNLVFLSIFTLLVGQLSANAFTQYSVENEAKVLLYWGDVEENVTSSTSQSYDGSIEGQNGRVLALQSIAFESSDEINHKDSRATGKVEFESNINSDVDGLLLLINENETELQVEMDTLGSHTIDINTLKSNNFEYNSGNFGLRAKYLGKDFLSTDSNPSGTSSFSDVPTSEWYFPYVQRIKNREVLDQPIFEGYKTASGNLTGQFGPGDNITVAEMLKVVLRVSGYDENTNNLDASLQGSNHWSVGFQNKAIDLGLTIMQAVGINPDRPVTRGEFFQTLAEAQGLMSSSNYNCDITDLDFEDLDSSNPYTLYACILVKDGIISGTDDGYLNLYNNINRAEVAKILNTALDTYVEQPNNIQSEINTVIALDESNNSTQTGGSVVLSDNLIQQSIPTSATRYYEVRSSTGLQMDSVDNSKITISNSTESYTGAEIESFIVNGNSNLRVKIKNQDWQETNYDIQFEEGAITYSDNSINSESNLNFDVNLVNDGSTLSWDVQDIEYNSALMALRLDVDDSTDVDLSTNPESSVSIQRENGGVPVLSVQVNKAFDDNDIVILLETDDSYSEAYAGGEYQISIDGLKYENGDTVPTFESTFKIYASYVNDGTAPLSITFSTPYRITFPNNSSAVRLDELEYTMYEVDGQTETDITAQLNEPTIDSSGRVVFKKDIQWANGDYRLTLNDTRFNESADFYFTVTN